MAGGIRHSANSMAPVLTDTAAPNAIPPTTTNVMAANQIWINLERVISFSMVLTLGQFISARDRFRTPMMTANMSGRWVSVHATAHPASRHRLVLMLLGNLRDDGFGRQQERRDRRGVL